MNVRFACFTFLVILLLFGLVFLFPARGLSHDLVIDGVSTTLWGEQYFNNITITNHGRLYISPYDGTTGGWLEVYVTGSLIISNGGAIIADNAGFYGGDHGQGEGPGGGIAGGGAGYASVGNHTNGATSGGGETYGDNVSFNTEMGSGGGSGLGDSGGRGGNGGGAIEIYGKCIRIDNSSYISSNGGTGEDSLSDVNPGGGGSGGGILLSADSIFLEGVLSSTGGTGGRPYGIPSDEMDGKGSFGRIKLFAFNLQVCRSTTLPITGNQIPDAFDLPTMELSESNASPVIETYTLSTILMMPGMDYGYYFNTYVNLAPPQYGKASYYGSVKKRLKTASGEYMKPYELTAAHRTYPFNTIVRVTRQDSGDQVDVRITDRGPFVKGRVIDLSYEAAKRIKMMGKGVVPVKIKILRKP